MSKRVKRTKKAARAAAAPAVPAAERREISLPPTLMVAALLALFLAASLGYRSMLPYGWGPDEVNHAMFVETLVGAPAGEVSWRWGLPVFSTDPHDPNFETHQPPLYYALAALGWFVFGLGWAQALSLAASLGVVWLTWRMAREIAGQDLALAAAAVVALLPMHAFMALRVSNDPLNQLFWALALWRWVIVLRDGPSDREGLWAGLALAGALLTKQSSVALGLLAVLTALLAGARTGQWRAAARHLAITLAVAAALAGWWYVRNLAVYGDLLAQAAFDAKFLHPEAGRPTPETMARQFVHRPEWSYWPFVTDWILRTFVVYIGSEFFRLPHQISPLQAWIFGLAVAGAAFVLVGRWRREGLSVAVVSMLLLGGGLLLVVLLLVRFNMTYFQAQGRYLFPMLPAWGLLLAGGFSRPFAPGTAARRYGLLVAPGWFGLLNLALLTAYVPGLLDANEATNR